MLMLKNPTLLETRGVDPLRKNLGDDLIPPPEWGESFKNMGVFYASGWWLNQPFEKYARQNGFIFPK